MIALLSAMRFSNSWRREGKRSSQECSLAFFKFLEFFSGEIPVQFFFQKFRQSLTKIVANSWKIPSPLISMLLWGFFVGPVAALDPSTLILGGKGLSANNILSGIVWEDFGLENFNRVGLVWFFFSRNFNDLLIVCLQVKKYNPIFLCPTYKL